MDQTQLVLTSARLSETHWAAFTCPGELLPANSGQQRPEDSSSHPAEAEEAAGQQITNICHH